MGSGALWLASIALDRDAASSLPELAPSCTQYIPVPYQYPRGSHASWATIITERDGDSYLSIPRYLGWLWLLGRRMGAYLFSSTC